MRKQLEAISLAVLALMAWITWQAFHGPTPLPERVPTHFDAAGNANGWGSPSTLLLLPAVAAGLYLLISVVALFPAAFNYPVRVTVENRARLQSLTLQMIAWLKAELVCLFTWIQWLILKFVREGHGRLSPLAMGLFLAAVFGTLGWHMMAIFRAARPE